MSSRDDILKFAQGLGWIDVEHYDPAVLVLKRANDSHDLDITWFDTTFSRVKSVVFVDRTGPYTTVRVLPGGLMAARRYLKEH